MHIDSATRTELQDLEAGLESRYRQLQQAQLRLDLTRGKPCAEQLSLSDALDGILGGDYHDADGVDVRNYGGLTGIRPARKFCAQVLGSAPENTIIGGNSSLTLMYQTMEFALNYGFSGQAWKNRGEMNFICPVPGYDRHFSVCEHLGIGMLTVPMTNAGPDMDAVEEMLRTDSSIVGIWCVPRFSNPTGVVYSPDAVARVARLGQIASPDFLVMWDNAYAVHSHSEEAPKLTDINGLLREYGTEDSVLQFGSTSKVTFAGAGMAFMAASAANVKTLTSHLGFSSIGPDKVNQLRHVRFLADMEGLRQHMRKHAAITRPRFERVQGLLEKELAETGMGTWTQPQGGYFVLFNSRPGLAANIVGMAANIGVKLTPAGATWPYGEDPADSDIRLAPTCADLEEVVAAMQAFIVCVKLASVRQKLGQP